MMKSWVLAWNVKDNGGRDVNPNKNFIKQHHSLILNVEESSSTSKTEKNHIRKENLEISKEEHELKLNEENGFWGDKFKKK